MWCIYTMKYYVAIKKNEIVPFVTAWMGLEGIMLSEISQVEKDTSKKQNKAIQNQKQTDGNRDHRGGCQRGAEGGKWVTK